MFKTIKVPLDLQKEEVRCDLCGSDKLNFWDLARGNILNACAECGLVFTNPRIKELDVKEKLFYNEKYFASSSLKWTITEIRKRAYSREIKTLERFARGRRIFDVGCGTGAFLKCLDSSWVKFGCDVSEYGLGEAQKNGVITRKGQFEELDLDGMVFDVIQFRASLHHAYSPSRCIEKAYNCLGEGGILAITMSNNSDGLCGRLFKGYVNSYEQPHNYLFSTATLSRYLNNKGFSISHMTYPYFGTGYSSFIDVVQLPFSYLRFLYLKNTKRLNDQIKNEFSSPPFYANYINIYAKKGVTSD